MRRPTMDEIVDAVKSSFTQDCVHSSAIHWDILKSSAGNQLFIVNYEGKKEYTITGDICRDTDVESPDDIKTFYRVGDPSTNEAIRFYEDHIEVFPTNRSESGEASFDSEPLDSLYIDFVSFIQDPEYDIYGKIWDRNDDGTYSLTKEAVEECEQRDKEIRDSRPEQMPTNAEIGANLLNHLFSTGALTQQILSAKHLLNANNITDTQSVLNLTEGECSKPNPERQKRINEILRYHGEAVLPDEY